MVKINKIYFDKDKELDSSTLGKIIRYFESHNLPSLRKYERYYNGQHEIMSRIPGDDSRPDNRIVKNYCAAIVDNFQGYITGVPVTYSASDNEDISPLLDTFSANDVVNTDSDFLLEALKCGVAYELCYYNEDKQIKFKNLCAQNVIPIYSADLDEELLYAIYYYPLVNWEEDFTDKFSVTVYSDKEVLRYESSANFNTFKLVSSDEHYFQKVPMVVFDLNKDNRPVFERIITLNDAYNTLLSDEVNDFESFVDAYLVLKNVCATPYELEEMKRNRTILIDGEDDVSYLTKDISDTQIQNMLENIQSSIHTISNSPDFSSEEFNNGVSSGLALQFKLVGFNNVASNVEAQFRKALACRINLINQVMALTDGEQPNVKITFTHNLPINTTDIVNTVNSLRGLVSDETLLAQIPFVDDVQTEIERTREAQGYQSYSFNSLAEEGVDNEQRTLLD